MPGFVVTVAEECTSPTSKMKIYNMETVTHGTVWMRWVWMQSVAFVAVVIGCVRNLSFLSFIIINHIFHLLVQTLGSQPWTRVSVLWLTIREGSKACSVWSCDPCCEVMGCNTAERGTRINKIPPLCSDRLRPCKKSSRRLAATERRRLSLPREWWTP